MYLENKYSKFFNEVGFLINKLTEAIEDAEYELNSSDPSLFALEEIQNRVIMELHSFTDEIE